MRLLEYQAKELLSEEGIPVPEGHVIRHPEEIRTGEEVLFLKAQVPSGGRGKAGGILCGSDSTEARKLAGELLGTELLGFQVDELLVEEGMDVERELYLSIIVDRSRGLPLMLASPEGGVDIESISDDRIGRFYIHPFLGVRDYMIREASTFLDLNDRREELGETLRRLWSVFRNYDCELVEVNPLVVTAAGKLVAVDAKVTINDDSLFRLKDIEPQEKGLTELERMAKSKSISLVQLKGNIGVIANGAGLTMATLDSLSNYGGQGGLFLDLGGTDDVEKVVDALSLVLEMDPDVILLNVFGGITKCDTVANGVVTAKKQLGIEVPLVARIRGVNEERAREILRAESIFALKTLDDACRKASELGGIE